MGVNQLHAQLQHLNIQGDMRCTSVCVKLTPSSNLGPTLSPPVPFLPSSSTPLAAPEGSSLSVSSAKLFSCPASPLGSPNLFPLSSVSQAFHLSSPLCFSFTRKPAFCTHHIRQLLSQSTPMASKAKSHRCFPGLTEDRG